MEDLKGKELKQSFKENILYALKNSKNSAIEIIFKFSGTHQGSYFRSTERITYFGGCFTYKDVCFNHYTIDNDTAIKIIVDNLCYDCFAFVECEENHGDIECHGFGEYWGEDKFVFIYHRMNCI